MFKTLEAVIQQLVNPIPVGGRDDQRFFVIHSKLAWANISFPII